MTKLTHLVLQEQPHLRDLSQLQVLSCLTSVHLHYSVEALSRAASYANLQNLDLQQPAARYFDPGCCTRLTSLVILAPLAFRELALPYGQNVQLQNLRLSLHDSMSNDCEEHGEFVLHNLACASNLVWLRLCRVSPSTPNAWLGRCQHLNMSKFYTCKVPYLKNFYCIHSCIRWI